MYNCVKFGKVHTASCFQVNLWFWEKGLTTFEFWNTNTSLSGLFCFFCLPFVNVGQRLLVFSRNYNWNTILWIGYQDGNIFIKSHYWVIWHLLIVEHIFYSFDSVSIVHRNGQTVTYCSSVLNLLLFVFCCCCCFQRLYILSIFILNVELWYLVLKTSVTIKTLFFNSATDLSNI